MARKTQAGTTTGRRHSAHTHVTRGRPSQSHNGYGFSTRHTNADQACGSPHNLAPHEPPSLSETAGQQPYRGLNHPGFGRDSLLGSGDQADQVAQLVQGLELDRWPALAGSVQSTVVVPIHPCRSGDVDLSYIVPWPAWFNQLGLVQTYQ